MNRITIEKLFDNKSANDFASMVCIGQFMEGETLRTINLITPNEWLTDCRYKYGEKTFLYYGTQAFNSFKTLFANWVAHNQQNINILTEAYYRKYNPLENYDKYSDIELTKDGVEITDLVKGTTNTKTERGSEKDTQTFTGSEKDSLTMTGTETNTNGVVPFDKTTFKSTEKTDTTFNNRKNENERTFTNRKNEVVRTFKGRTTTDALTGKDSNTLSFNDRKDKTVEHTHGQIGVTANFQLIEGETKARMKDLSSRILESFINEYCCNMISE